MSELDRERREMAAVLQGSGVGPDPKLKITPTHIHPPIMLNRRGNGRPDFRLVAAN